MMSSMIVLKIYLEREEREPVYTIRRVALGFLHHGMVAWRRWRFDITCLDRSLLSGNNQYIHDAFVTHSCLLET
jgi:hypothetical protein